MRKSGLGAESIFLSSLPIVFLLAAVAAALVHTHAHFANDRVQYAVEHLTIALLSVAVFSGIVASGIVAFLRFRPATNSTISSKPTYVYILALALIFSSFWLPVLFAGGFVQDDWMLLAGASIRKIIYLHPQYSWQALDTVDGNYRPLGTVLYVGLMLKLAGLHPLAFLATNFVVSLLGSLTAFFIVRELNYGKVAGAAAAILYMSRGLTYTENAWMSALGDGLAILLCALTVLAVLKAMKPAPRASPPAAPFSPLSELSSITPSASFVSVSPCSRSKAPSPSPPSSRRSSSSGQEMFPHALAANVSCTRSPPCSSTEPPPPWSSCMRNHCSG